MATQPAKMAPYGSWKSPITSDLIVSQAISLSEVRLDKGLAYWLEGRPQEQGRSVIVRAGATGPEQPREQADIVAPPYNVRTRVHEYGGGAWSVTDGTLYFSNFSDGQLYRLTDGAAKPEPLTPVPPGASGAWRYADGIIDRSRNRWIGVREDHSGSGAPVNTIVAVDLAGSGSDPGHVIASGHDFFSSPRLSPDGSKLVWLAWDHPNMPWNGTTLYLAELHGDGAVVGETRAIAGGEAESIFQPEWSPDGTHIVFVSDQSGWWNLYRFELATHAIHPIAPMTAEFGQPQWVFGMSTYAFAGPDRIVCTYLQAGLGKLAVVDFVSGALQPIEIPFTQFASVQASGDQVVFVAGAPSLPTSVVELDLKSGRHRILKKATEVLDSSDVAIAGYLTAVQSIEFPTSGGNTAFALFYPPRNLDYAGPPDKKPPLLVKCHGGPTSAASSSLSLGTHYWTSRGIAVLDVNYGGSTGFGRAYRDRLHRNWGIVDVDDCINGAKFLAEQGLVDPKRIVITGGSAGGYTTLAALTFHDFFQGGASYYGVSDAAALARDTHKFESRYLDWLIGPYPEEEALYRERSPLFHAERLAKPVIFFQGDEDEVIPPGQTETMVSALRSSGKPVGYFLFSGEQHGFRQAANIKRALDAELYFYAFEVFRTGLTF
ncbi:prolyl oligopeptidase family serine peptidase [Mesorhizobium sp. BAC0120]|uniref:S9 family peptidase n=1 Tax=Mesorhizobium sp. BAC0120 TaxID=3090670 RepID=UPI00298BF800|nr:prolyl oligopeptidase family serine peptidase [Mesorhizobium sp. BAC0120]MDW6022259.1 prolyl oligopeptidase family serine peptidase [Mesorhizobium sp. BAC0120]